MNVLMVRVSMVLGEISVGLPQGPNIETIDNEARMMGDAFLKIYKFERDCLLSRAYLSYLTQLIFIVVFLPNALGFHIFTMSGFRYVRI